MPNHDGLNATPLRELPHFKIPRGFDLGGKVQCRGQPALKACHFQQRQSCCRLSFSDETSPRGAAAA
jgi:hypothetical protein